MDASFTIKFSAIWARDVTARAARVLVASVKLAPMLLITSLKSLWMCSLWRSQGMFIPGPPWVLTNLPDVSWCTRSGGRVVSWSCNLSASRAYFVLLYSRRGSGAWKPSNTEYLVCQPLTPGVSELLSRKQNGTKHVRRHSCTLHPHSPLLAVRESPQEWWCTGLQIFWARSAVQTCPVAEPRQSESGLSKISSIHAAATIWPLKMMVMSPSKHA